MASYPYRNKAKEVLTRAKQQLAAGQLQYAALELRLAIEALTYDRAQSYAKEIPPAEMGTWQPNKVMQVLLEIEPHADQSYSVRIGQEPYPGGEPEKMMPLGTETVFSLAKIKKHYNAVGNALHMPTMQQIEAGQPSDQAKLKSRLELVADELDKALSSPIANFNFGLFSTADCFRCGKSIRKRISAESETVEAICFECKAPYRVSKLGNQVKWEPIAEDWPCKTEGCPEVFTLWRDKVINGAAWQCKSCQTNYQFRLAIFTDSAAEPVGAKSPLTSP